MMSSYAGVTSDESLFLLDEQPPTNLQKSASFDDEENKSSGLKSLQRMLSVSSSLTSANVARGGTTSANGGVASHRSLSAHDLTPGLPPHQSRRSTSAGRSQTSDIDAFVRQFETRLREHRLLWQKEYDSTVQRLTEAKNNELESLKTRYETKLRALEDGNQQLESILEQLSEENKRLKFELEHEKQQHKVEQVKDLNMVSFIILIHGSIYSS